MVAAVLAGLVFAGQPVQAQEGAKVGNWKTWHVTSPDEITVPAPPSDTSDQTKTELNELRTLQARRLDSPALTALANSWNGIAAVQRWTDVAIRIPIHPVYGTRISAYMHTAMLDAVIVAYRAKYTHNRKAPSQLATGLTPAFATVGSEPSYPSEHAAIAGAASAVLAFLDPSAARTYEAMAQDQALSRLVAGTNYRSDIEAGLALGRAVAEKAIARAKTDGSDSLNFDPLPTGPGIWSGPFTVGRTKGQWKPWLMTSGSQFRAAPPPAFDSAEFKAAIAEVKQRATSVTSVEKALHDYWNPTGPYIPFYGLAYSAMAQEKASVPRAARIASHMATAADDAAIACWDSKFFYMVPRPSQVDPTIPLLTPVPPYPDHTSGFNSQSGALSESIAYFFPQEAPRARDMADQCVELRIYQGIHTRFADVAGRLQGQQCAQLAADRDKTFDQ
jgi:hypothetical protein